MSELPDHEPTGVESVDRVLAEVSALADAPVAEHVAVFERAHEQLRWRCLTERRKAVLAAHKARVAATAVH